MKIRDEEYAAILRASLAEFIERTFTHLNPGVDYLPNWHIELIASKLEAVYEGRITRLIINVPPRSLKSIMASVAFVAWALGHKPSLSFICASYGQDLAMKHALDCRNVMTSAWYQRLFGVRLKASRQAASDLRTVGGGGRLATSVGGVLTGLGGDIIVIDDPLKPDEAVSQASRTAANEWIDSTVMSRFNDKRTGAMILIMQRLHTDDVVGHVLEHGGWEVVSMPAVAEVNERHRIESAVFGNREVFRSAGEALHPEREPLEVLQDLRRTLGEYNFAGQYQQAPSPLGGGIFKESWLQYYDASAVAEGFEQIVQSWDTANKESELADYSACTTWGVRGKQRFLRDVFRAKLDFPKLKKAVIDQICKHNPAVVLVEDKASGVQLIQELRAMDIHVVKEVHAKGDKVMRANAQTAGFEGGVVLLPHRAPWLEAYVLELTTFPRARHDDQVDSTVQALDWINVNGVEPAIFGYLRLLAQEKKFE